MVNSIRGILTFKSPDFLGIETGGVEWILEVSTTTLSALPGPGKEIRVFTYLHHTQDVMKMYGFANADERKIFLALLTVNGVGPSLARKILSGITPQAFQTALDSEDLALLERIPGLGKKTAQKIVLHLRGKLVDDDAEVFGAPSAAKEVVEALAAMGFDSRGALKAVEAILTDSEVSQLTGEEREKEVLRRAIISLSS